ncbi:MAG: electron transfer flavoprotein subunit alpha/FixB family protein [Dehalococcoidales bacterium]|nr:electron transfer flavoprotein subunit alpha/FixB family protein [Dehalococcoidales bacterium]
MAEYNGILVFCEVANDKLAPIAVELLGAGSRLAEESGEPMSAVVIGSGISALAQEAASYGASKVYAVDDPLLKEYLIDSYLTVTEKVIKEAMPKVVLLGQTQIGRDLTPRLAFRLNTAAVMDCIALAVDADSKRVLMTKPVYGGNAQAVQVCGSDPQIATIRSKAMAPAVKDESKKGEIVNVAAGIDPASLRTKVLERKIEAGGGVKLEDAQIIVTGGRGIGNAEGFKQLEELAAILKGAVGASRPPCDNKWVPDSLQIGLTGKIVGPDVYIAIGVSGSSQHLSGCSGSKIIVAINKDAEANIFKVANYGVVADWKKALPAFTAKVKELVG